MMPIVFGFQYKTISVSEGSSSPRPENPIAPTNEMTGPRVGRASPKATGTDK